LFISIYNNKTASALFPQKLEELHLKTICRFVKTKMV
jgi:hypothetical protein